MRVEKAGEKTLLERENRRLRFQVQRGLASDILTRSPALQKVLRTLEKVAGARTPVLIEGESGVGKELLAQHLHRLSPRAAQGVRGPQLRGGARRPCSRASCSATSAGPSRAPPTRSRGSSRWRTAARCSWTRSARWSPEIQSKFLRVLDSGTFYRVGATRKRRADFRLVAATNRDLKGEVAAGRFRKDLFFRVHGVQRGDPAAARAARGHPAAGRALHAAAARATKRFSPPALAALWPSYDWPGNVRELHFAVERAGLLAEGEMIDVDDLPPGDRREDGARVGLAARRGPERAVARRPGRRRPRRRRRRRAGLRAGQGGARESQVAAREGR